MRRSQALGLSVLLHLSVFGIMTWVLGWGFARSEAEKRSIKHEPLVEVSVEITEGQADKKLNTGIAKKRRSASARAAGTRLHQNLKSFIPSIGQKLLTGSSSGVEAFSSLAKFGEGTGDLKKLEDFSFYNHVWTLLDERLKYPGILAERRIQGIVNVSLIVTDDGSMDWKNLRLEGGNKYLRFYVLRVLREAFLKNLELHRFPKLKTPHQLDFIFEFHISERPIQEAKVGRSFTMGQLMTFSRSAQRSHMEWELGPLRGLFPIPAVSLDVFGFTDHLINGDPLLRFLKGE